MPVKKLYRSRKNRIIFGIAGGIGEFLDVDPTIIIILWLLSAFLGAPIIFYILLLFVIPEKPNYWG
ncbi:PspC domain-containing protein [Caviibacter abscessus]|uniref:PspC domain-containing protein n=1 Tax=Caviibacter abscessus TaxID=1766719 RepID=UPI00082A195A|nr:PspC domain-containing protein [Caviibacter abscessus]